GSTIWLARRIDAWTARLSRMPSSVRCHVKKDRCFGGCPLGRIGCAMAHPPSGHGRGEARRDPPSVELPTPSPRRRAAQVTNSSGNLGTREQLVKRPHRRNARSAAVAPVPACQALHPEPVVAERVGALLVAGRPGQHPEAVELARRSTVAGAAMLGLAAV